MTLVEILYGSASSAIEDQRNNGSMPSGHNGPYYDDETPVRNTAHWLITFGKAHRISGRPSFRSTAQKAVRYLLGDEARPMGQTFWHRKNPEKDTCNGLIGQAWTIEALVTAAEMLETREPIRVAEEVFLLHPFQDEIGLWRRVAVDGQRLSLDYTLNHQIWFAAAGAMLAPYTDSSIDKQVARFLDQLDVHFRTHMSGLIKHGILTAYNLRVSNWRTILKRRIRRGVEVFSPSVPETKETGYHPFNLYGLAMLYKKSPNHSFWDSSSFRRACEYLKTDKFQEEIYESPYAFPYNPAGFEVAFALDTFTNIFPDNTKNRQEEWVKEQLGYCYDEKTNLMERNTEDKKTLSARLYECTRLNDLNLAV